MVGLGRIGMLARAIIPPSNVKTVPVIHSLVTNNNVACATSSTVPNRPRGMHGAHISTTLVSANILAVRSTGTTPGAMALTRTPSGAYSIANPRVSDSNAAFDAA